MNAIYGNCQSRQHIFSNQNTKNSRSIWTFTFRIGPGVVIRASGTVHFYGSLLYSDSYKPFISSIRWSLVPNCVVQYSSKSAIRRSTRLRHASLSCDMSLVTPRSKDSDTVPSSLVRSEGRLMSHRGFNHSINDIVKVHFILFYLNSIQSIILFCSVILEFPIFFFSVYSIFLLSVL